MFVLTTPQVLSFVLDAQSRFFNTWNVAYLPVSSLQGGRLMQQDE